MKQRVLIFVVCYNAESSIAKVLDRIPAEVWKSERFDVEVLIIDDQSADRTWSVAQEYSTRWPDRNIKVLYNPKNQGYGGNQKIGYHYAVKEGFTAAVLLHGDGQYAPEHIGRMIQPILDGEADVVFGSRMLRRLDALKGGMPLYKWVGNQILTFLQNRVLGSRLSEFHTGYRAYRVSALASAPFEHNSDYFDFDTDIIIQMLQTKRRILEIAIPTFYGDEISRVNGLKYAARILMSSVLSRVTRLGIYYHPKFDYETSNTRYEGKFGYASSQQWALDRIRPEATVLDVGCGPGLMTAELAKKNARTVSLDREIQPSVREHSWKWIEADLDRYDFTEDSFGKVDWVLVLDVIEHLKSPERFLRRLRERFSREAPEVLFTTGNVAFFPIRIGLLLGSLNYGKRGILDMDHSRLFTFSTLRRILEINGYEIVAERGIPAPFPLAVGPGRLSRFLLAMNRVLIFLSKGLFSYQIAVVAKPRPTLEHLLHDAHDKKWQRDDATRHERTEA